ncbi:MAG TPA: pitrilysin family protein [Saprospiraceae bacterium]|nr:pitrilysin family protein [Saprospiraceae bacterium]
MQHIKYFIVCLAVLSLSYCAPKVGEQVGKAPQTETPQITDFRSQAPEAGAARKIEIGTYETFALDNGLRVIVVESHKIPRISYQIFVDRDPSLEGDIAGMTDIAGDLLNKGTTTRTKAQIDESIDFVGASLSTHAQGGFASALTRHSETVLAIFSDVILNPGFPEDEFEKARKQTISGLQTEKDDPNAISANVSNALVYGKNHPYGEITTEVSVSNITLDDCKGYYQKYFKPDITYLVIVGDITLSQARVQAEKYFGSWKRGVVGEMTYEIPQQPAKTRVEFVDKTGAVQSVINIVYPVDLKPAAPDVIPSRVMNTILGSGFSGRLFKNLREDKAYTYGAYSNLSSDEIVGEFSASASVRNEVTDSAIVQFLNELNTLRTEEVSDLEIELAKNYIAGSFARNLESPQTIAGFALNTFRYGLPQDYYVTYLEQLDKVTKADVLAMAAKYIRPENAHIVVVGNQDAVSEKLAVFDQEDGKVDYYDIYGNKKAAPSTSAVNVNGQDVIMGYLEAIGGEEKLRSITSMKIEAIMPIPGMGEVSVLIEQMAPAKMHMTMGMPGMVMMKQVCDGEKGYIEQMGPRQMLEGETLEKAKHEAQIFPEMAYLGNKFKIDVKGMEEVNGVNTYKVIVNGPVGVSTEYYSIDHGYKLKSVVVEEAGEQAQTVIREYSDYREVSGIYVPYSVKISGMVPFPLEMKISHVEVNPKIDPGVFVVE